MHNTNFKKAETVNFSTINSIMRVLNNALQNNPLLANELLQFLEDKNINVPTLSQKELSDLIPVSYNNKNSTKQMQKLKWSFEGTCVIDNLI